MNNMKVAIAFDWLNIYGGAEKTLEVFLELYPDADIYTSIYDQTKLPNHLKNLNVKTSFIQKLPFGRSKYRNYLPLMPMAFEQFDLRSYDLVISNSHAFAKGVITGPQTLHVCYCFTPMRWAWDMYHDYLENEEIKGLKKIFLTPLINYLRLWDVTSSNRVDHFIAISGHIAGRIKKFYNRDSSVIYPPVETKKFEGDDISQDYYLVVSRLVSQKRVDIIVEAFNELKLPLIIIGKGRDLDKLKAMAKSNIKFLGYQKDEVVAEYMKKCKAFVFASYEDFGIAPIEANAAGKPAIVYGAGGALETIVADGTGVFFDKQEKDSVVSAVKRFETMTFDSKKIIVHAKKFDREMFKKNVKEFIDARCIDFFRGAK